jgi:hypothetical protein
MDLAECLTGLQPQPWSRLRGESSGPWNSTNSGQSSSTALTGMGGPMSSCALPSSTWARLPPPRRRLPLSRRPALESSSTSPSSLLYKSGYRDDRPASRLTKACQAVAFLHLESVNASQAKDMRNVKQAGRPKMVSSGRRARIL